jgi:hypothetical protein
MNSIVRQTKGQGAAEAVRCPSCGQDITATRHCRHVRWTFDQGDPLEFARFAMETSPYTHARGFSLRDIPATWWDENGPWVVDRVMSRFDARDGYVFGEPADMDLLARDVWKAFRPDPVRPEMARIDPI